jgi:hypothetical protein
MKELEKRLKRYENTLISIYNVHIFRDIFNEFLKNYTGRSKAPKCEYFGFGKIGKIEETEKMQSYFSVYVDNGTDTPKATITLVFLPILGIIEYKATLEAALKNIRDTNSAIADVLSRL